MNPVRHLWIETPSDSLDREHAVRSEQVLALALRWGENGHTKSHP